jgi:hypothetical protein
MKFLTLKTFLSIKLLKTARPFLFLDILMRVNITFSIYSTTVRIPRSTHFLTELQITIRGTIISYTRPLGATLSVMFSEL